MIIRRGPCRAAPEVDDATARRTDRTLLRRLRAARLGRDGAPATTRRCTSPTRCSTCTARDAGLMWRMLCTNGRDLQLEFSGIVADDARGPGALGRALHLQRHRPQGAQPHRRTLRVPRRPDRAPRRPLRLLAPGRARRSGCRAGCSAGAGCAARQGAGAGGEEPGGVRDQGRLDQAQHSTMFTARPPRAVSLYLVIMSAPVSRIVLITLSS